MSRRYEKVGPVLVGAGVLDWHLEPEPGHKFELTHFLAVANFAAADAAGLLYEGPSLTLTWLMYQPADAVGFHTIWHDFNGLPIEPGERVSMYMGAPGGGTMLATLGYIDVDFT